ncbi:MAG TPA: hypothetical protein VIM07_13425 [Chitinophagaceae bacterium]
MLAIILTITFIALCILCIGFFEIRVPFITVPADEYLSYKVIMRANRHARKMMRKRMVYNNIHKGFIDLQS